jgi:hypothetical protein
MCSPCRRASQNQWLLVTIPLCRAMDQLLQPRVLQPLQLRPPQRPMLPVMQRHDVRGTLPESQLQPLTRWGARDGQACMLGGGMRPDHSMQDASARQCPARCAKPCTSCCIAPPPSTDAQLHARDVNDLGHPCVHSCRVTAPTDSQHCKCDCTAVGMVCTHVTSCIHTTHIVAQRCQCIAMVAGT